MIRIIPTLAGLIALCVIAFAPSASADDHEALPLLTAWQDESEVHYYDMGTDTTVASPNTVNTAPVWILIDGFNDDGSPHKVDGQRSIFDVLPGDPGYSDLWEMYLVTVPDNYEANSITSADEIAAAGYPVEPTGVFVNCPFVEEGTVLQDGRKAVLGWVNGEKVYYLDFGPASDEIGRGWLLLNDLELYKGSADFEDASMIFEAVPRQDDPTAFRRMDLVLLPSGVDSASITSELQLVALGLEAIPTGSVFNLPIVDDTTASPPASQPEGYGATGDGTGSTSLRWLVLGVVALGALAIASVFLVTRKPNRLAG